MLVLPAAESPDKLRMGATIRSETAAAEPDPAGQVLTGEADLEERDTLIELAVTDPGGEMSVPLADPERIPTPFSRLGLSKLVSLPGRHRRQLAEARAKLEASEARSVVLEKDLAAQVDAVRQAATAHAAQVSALEAQAGEQLEATRHDAETALDILAKELEARSASQLETAVREARDDAVRAATETAQQHEAALMEVEAHLEEAEARRGTLEQDLASQVDAVRQAETAHAAQVTELEAQASALADVRVQLKDTEARRVALERDLTVQVDAARQADGAHAAQVAALEARAAAHLETSRHDADDALAAQEIALEARATSEVKAAVHQAQTVAAQALVETVKQHDTAQAQARARLKDTESRRVALEQELAVQIDAGRQADAAHAAGVAALDAQLQTTRHDAETALEILATELETQHDAALAEVRGHLEEMEARRGALERDLAVQINALHEANTVHTAQVAALEAQAAGRLEAARRDAGAALAAQETDLELQAAAQVEAAVREAQTESAQMLVATMQQHDVALAEVRGHLEEAEARRGTLEHDLAVQINALHNAGTAHAAQVAASEAQAAERLEAARREAAAALAARETELEAHSTSRLETEVRETRDAAARAATDIAQRHEAALAAVRAQLEETETRRGTLEQDLAAKIDAARQADTAHAAQVAGLEAQAAERLEATRREAAAALATRETELEAHSASQLETEVRETRDAAARAATDIAQRHEAALAAVRAQLEETETRRGTLEQDLAAKIDAARQADTAHAAQVAGLEAQAAERLEATRREAAAALATRETELEAHSASQLETEVRETRDAAARAATDIAQRHEAALAAVRAQLEETETRRGTLEQDLAAKIDAARQADTAHAAQVAALEAQAAERLEATRREAAAALAARVAALEAEATNLARQHESALAAVRAQLEEAEARHVTLEQDFALQVDTLRRETASAHAAQVSAMVRQAQDEAAQLLVATVQKYDASLAAVRAQLEQAEARRVTLEQDLATQVDTARRETATAHAAQAAASEAKAADRIEAVRHQANTALAARETELAELKQELNDRVEAQAAAQVEAAVRGSAETAKQRDAAVEARARADVARAEQRLAEVEQTLNATRKKVDLAQAEVERLRADRTDQREQARREARGHYERQLAHLKVQFSAMREADQDTTVIPAKRITVTRRGMVEVAGALVLAGVTGTLAGWFVVLSGIL